MDVPADRSTRAVVQRIPPGTVRRARRRRPTGEPPPLPRHLQTSGVGWLVAALVLIALLIVVFAGGMHGLAVDVTVADDAVARWLGKVHPPGLLAVERGLAAISSWWVLNGLAVGVLLVLLALRRFRHLIVLVILANLVTFLAGDVLGAVAQRPRPFGVAIPLLVFRLFLPNELFPVTYRRGRAAHLDVGGARGVAIRQGLEDQLGLVIEEVKPFGLAGSGGSTPLRVTVKGEQPSYLFAKLYAKGHLRADRWYKLGRELLYGRLEDEKPFNTVRRLVQQEDYALRLCRDAGLPSPTPFGFVELTPDREYLLVTEFFDGAVELGEATVDDRIIDDGLGIIRRLWDAGLAHRDIKPANLLVRDGRMLLIDVAFVEARPSPWRQAVDLANMMLCLALRSSPEQVYRRALAQFSVEEISEGFAAARGLALPSQLRRMLREESRDLHDEFVRLLPTAPQPIRVQRWSARRVGLWAAIVLLLVLVALNPTVIFDNRMAVRTSLDIHSLDCGQLEPLWLEAQSVPSASLVPCVRSRVPGWKVADVAVNNGRSVITLDHDRAGSGAVVVRLAAVCDTVGTVETPSPTQGVRRYQRVDLATDAFGATWYDRFAGGCVSYRLHSTSDVEGSFAIELPGLLGFTSRDGLREALSQRSGGRLELDLKHDEP